MRLKIKQVLPAGIFLMIMFASLCAQEIPKDLIDPPREFSVMHVCNISILCEATWLPDKPEFPLSFKRQWIDHFTVKASVSQEDETVHFKPHEMKVLRISNIK